MKTKRGRPAVTLVASLLLAGFLVTVTTTSVGKKKKKRKRGNRGRDANALKVGQEAPTFKLKSLDGKTETALKSFRGKKPVVLLFGSYT